jgi:hypothetical protein
VDDDQFGYKIGKNKIKIWLIKKKTKIQKKIKASIYIVFRPTQT